MFYVTCVELIVEVCDVAAGKSKDFDLAKLPVRWLRRDEHTERVKGSVHAAWK